MNSRRDLRDDCQPWNDFIDKQTFGKILRKSGRVIDDDYFEYLWNSCQPTDRGISYEMFRRHFVPVEDHRKKDFSKSNKNLSSKQCRILNYTTRICHIVKQHSQNLINEFFSLDRYGRLFITIDQAINLMKKYCFPLNDKQQCELALLFSPKNNGQFNYFDFMKCFTNQSPSKVVNQGIFSRSTYTILSKQSWTFALITIDSILNRIRSECMNKYGSIYRMFKIVDKHRQGYLTKIQFKQLLKLFNIQLDDEELYHLVSEIDRNQDGLISYDELYSSLIVDALTI